jgi:hypothetical protein
MVLPKELLKLRLLLVMVFVLEPPLPPPQALTSQANVRHAALKRK